MDKDTTPTPVVTPGAKYRGAVVEVSHFSSRQSPSAWSVQRKRDCAICNLTSRDGRKLMSNHLQDLQLPPAFCLPHDAPLRLALEAAYEREFDQLPYVQPVFSRF